MCDYKKMSVKVSAFYEIRDSELYGGSGSIGYACTSITGNGEMIHNDFEAYISKQKKDFALRLGVPEECVRIITEEEYELNTEDITDGKE